MHNKLTYNKAMRFTKYDSLGRACIHNLADHCDGVALYHAGV